MAQWRDGAMVRWRRSVAVRSAAAAFQTKPTDLKPVLCNVMTSTRPAAEFERPASSVEGVCVSHLTCWAFIAFFLERLYVRATYVQPLLRLLILERLDAAATAPSRSVVLRTQIGWMITKKTVNFL